MSKYYALFVKKAEPNVQISTRFLNTVPKVEKMCLAKQKHELIFFMTTLCTEQLRSIKTINIAEQEVNVVYGNYLNNSD